MGGQTGLVCQVPAGLACQMSIQRLEFNIILAWFFFTAAFCIHDGVLFDTSFLAFLFLFTCGKYP